MTTKYKTVLLFGAPGAGKGTQGKILGTIPGYYHCACGDVFRSIDIHSELGKIFHDYSSRGELVPDEVTVRMWQEAIHASTVTKAFKPDRDLLILDGIPRTVEQAKIIGDYIETLRLVHLVCKNEEAMFERLRRRALKENRHDDADEKVIRHRWKVYEEETAPVLEYFSREMVSEVDAVQSPAGVLCDVLKIVMPIQEAHFAKFKA